MKNRKYSKHLVDGPNQAASRSMLRGAGFTSEDFKKPSKIRTVIVADFDNDGYDEIFLNNIGEPNKLFKIRNNGQIEEIDITLNSEANGLGTGAAVADIDKDGILELLIAHGENGNQILTLYKANVKKNKNFIRIKALNNFLLIYPSKRLYNMFNIFF